MSHFKKHLEFILKHNLIIQKLYKVIVGNIFRAIGHFLKTENNLVLINSFGGRRYNDSPKAIFEYLKSNPKYEYLDIVWAFEEPEKFNIPCRKVKIDSWNYFKTALKAKYWITCVNIERGLHFKKKGTRYLNTWHGTPLKLVGNAVSGRRDFDCSNVDIFCYAGRYEYNINVRDFGVRPESLLCSGLPRNDELYHISSERITILRTVLNIPSDKKVILYAPTWRDSKNGGKTYAIKPPIDIDWWQKQLGNEYVILFRMHAFTTQLMGLEFNDFVRDMSTYPDINDLMIVADMLISDYSATIFDYSILERPIICFAYDYETYAKERGLYINLEEELPSGICLTEQEVITKVRTLDYTEECRKTKLFKNKYLEVGGKAIQLCVEKLFGGIKNKYLYR